MAVNIGVGFNPNTQEPLDSRSVVANNTERLAIPWFNLYEGLLVYQSDENRYYACTNPGSETSDSVWIALAFAEGSGAVFPFSGSAVISGSLTITGSSLIYGPSVISGSLTLHSGSIKTPGPMIIGQGSYLVDTTNDLYVENSLFAPIISSSKSVITGDGTPGDLFLVKTNSSADAKFVINLDGVTILGAFTETPTAQEGGMFYSASGDFYLGY